MAREFSRFSFYLLLIAAASLVVRAEIIDRIAISVGNQVITESQVEEDVRITAFLNGETVNLALPERKKAAGRLIEQALVKQEMEFNRYPLPALSDADASLKEMQARYKEAAAFENALKQYGITEVELQQRLVWQLTLLRFIDYRFRPGIQLSDSDVEAYYQQQVSKWHAQGIQPIPNLEDSRPQIEEILTQQRIDQDLDRWLEQARTEVNIRYHDEALS